MKYYRVVATDASGIGWNDWELYELDDIEDIHDAEEYYRRNNTWLELCDCERMHSEEITEEQYNTSMQYKKYCEAIGSQKVYELQSSNLYQLKEWAILYADKDKPIKIGFPYMYSVYKHQITAKGKSILNFIYYYSKHDIERIKL